MIETVMPDDRPAHRSVSLFRNGRNQAVRIPKGMELPGTEAVIHRDGDRLILEPAPPPSLLQHLKTLSPIEDDFADIADLPPRPAAL